jgi:superfamily II DNA or RNA helicase
MARSPRNTNPVPLIALDDLAKLVDRMTFARGRSYAVDGHISGMSETSGGIAGTFRSSKSIAVFVSGATRTTLKYVCACEKVGKKPPCVHVVALVHAYLQDGVPRGSSSASPPRVERGPLHEGMTEPEIEAWVAGPGGGMSLARFVRELDPFLRPPFPAIPSRLQGLTVHAALAVAAETDADRRALAEVYAWLERQGEIASAVAASVARRAAARTPPSDPVLAAPWDTLISALATYPRPGSSVLVPHGVSRTFTATANPPTLTCQLSGRCQVCFTDAATKPVALTPEGDAPISVCPWAGAPSGCPVTFEGLQSLLDVLAEPTPAPEVVVFRDGLAHPRWARLLEAIDRELDESDDDVVGYRVLPGVRGLQIRPVLLARTKRGVSIKVLRALPEAASVDDRLRFQAVASTDAANDPVSVSFVLSTLIGSPNVVGQKDQPVSVVHADLALIASEPGLGELDPDVSGAGAGTVGAGTVESGTEPAGAGAFVISLRLGDKVFALRDVAELVARGARHLAATGADSNTVLVGALTSRLRRLARAFGGAEVAFPAESGAAVVRRLARTEAPLALPAYLEGVRRDSLMIPVLRAAWERPILRLSFGFRHHADYPVLTPGVGPERLYVTEDGAVANILRDRDDELTRSRSAETWLGLPTQSLEAEAGIALDLRDRMDVLTRLGDIDDPDRPPGLVVEWTRATPKVRTAEARSFQLRVATERDWFGLAGGVTVDGTEIPLALLLRAIRDRQQYVELAPDEFVVLGESLTEALGAVAAVAEAHTKKGAGEAWRVSRLGAASLGELDALGVEVDAPKAWGSVMSRIAESRTQEVHVPAGLNAELRHYQRAGYEWIARLAHWAPGACLCDDMGLGKTVQAVALLLARQSDGPSLVVGPMSVGFNWVREIERFAPSLTPRLFRGISSMAMLEGPAPGTVIVASYELLAYYDSAFSAVTWGTVVFDEAQALKNASTRRARAAANLDAGFRLGLSGTPIENRTEELWSLFNVTLPGLLGTADRFRERFAIPIERHKDARASRQLARLIRPFVLRRLKQQVATELPARTDLIIEVVLSAAERAAYDAIRRSVLETLTSETDGPAGQRHIQVLAALTRLRQAACHPRLIDPSSRIPSSKLAAFLELLDALRSEGHRALIFSQFTSHLAVVREALTARRVPYRYLDGSTSAKARKAEVDAFQAGEGDVFLLSLKAGGTGLNLTGADYVIHLDPWWNPSVEDQATDRAHRIGQTRPVTVYRLVSTGTIEETILALHADKRELMTTLLDGTGATAAMSTEELVSLIAGASQEALLDDVLDDDALDDDGDDEDAPTSRAP